MVVSEIADATRFRVDRAEALLQVRGPRYLPHLEFDLQLCAGSHDRLRLHKRRKERTMASFALASALFHRVMRAFDFLHDAFIDFLPAALLRQQPHAPPPPSTTMPRAKGTKAVVDTAVTDTQKRQMIHVKTKEECRLANETIDVWSIELPSKHAESILKYRHSISPIYAPY